MKRWTFWLALGAFLAAAVPAFAVTVDEVIGLTRARASDTIILSKIEADGTVFHLTVDEILALKEAGVSDPVITYMINTGKGGQDAIPPDERVEEEVSYDDEVETEDADRYTTGLDSRYRGTTVVAFAHYYPHWPGYMWSYYYDPFWWPNLAFYFAYWQPYPYGYWYYDPWYRCHAGSGWYWGHDHYDRYAYLHHDGYDRVHKGRNVGSRGPAEGYDRSTKSRYASRPSYEDTRQRALRPGPAEGRTTREVKPDRPGANRTRQVRQPRQPSPPAGEVDAPKPSPGRSVKPAPRPTETGQDRPSRDSGRSLKPAPAPARPQPSARPAPAPRPAPGNAREDSRARKH